MSVPSTIAMFCIILGLRTSTRHLIRECIKGTVMSLTEHQRRVGDSFLVYAQFKPQMPY